MKRMFFLAAISLLSAAGASAQRIVMAEFQTASTGKQYAVILDAGWFDGILYYDYDIEAESNVLFDAVGVHVDMENLRKFRNAAGRLTAEYMKCINEANASGEETFSKDLKLRFPPVNLDVIFEGVLTRTDQARLAIRFSRQDGTDQLFVYSEPRVIALRKEGIPTSYHNMTVYWAFSSVEEINNFAACLDKSLADEVVSRIKNAEKENTRAQRQATRPILKLLSDSPVGNKLFYRHREAPMSLSVLFFRLSYPVHL